MRCEAMRCDTMAVELVGSITRGAAYTVVEKRSEIIDAIATEASPFDGATDKGRSTILSHLDLFPPSSPFSSER